MLDTLLKHLDMVRLSAGMALLVLVMGCSGLIEGGGGGNGSGSGSDLTAIAQQKWATEAYPLFQQNCISCHGIANSQTYPGFLVGTDAPSVRTAILGFNPDVVDTSAAASSAVLTKNVHEGPAWTNDVDGSGSTNEAATILDWIQAEVDAAGAGNGSGSTITIETDLITPTLCQIAAGTDDSSCAKTVVDLTSIGLPGATISFVAQPLTATEGLYIDYLTLNGAGAGAYIEHPLFVSYPPGAGQGAQVGMNPVDPIPDDIDRFYNLKLDVMPSATSVIGPGEAAFLTFAPNDPIKIGFKVVMPYQPTTTGTSSGGCKDITDFITHAQPDLNSRCATCHAGTANANAKANMDLDGIASPTDPTMIAAACAQALSHVTLNQVASSGLLIEPDPAQAAGHPYKINDGTLGTYQANLTLWITPEGQ